MNTTARTAVLAHLATLEMVAPMLTLTDFSAIASAVVGSAIGVKGSEKFQAEVAQRVQAAADANRAALGLV